MELSSASEDPAEASSLSPFLSLSLSLLCLYFNTTTLERNPRFLRSATLFRSALRVSISERLASCSSCCAAWADSRAVLASILAFTLASLISIFSLACQEYI